MFRRTKAQLDANVAGRQFFTPSVLLVFGFLILVSKLYSGEAPSTVAVFLGMGFMILGTYFFLRVIVFRKNDKGS